MKKYIAIVAAAGALAAALIIPAGASAAPSENSPVWTTGCGSIKNEHNEALRFSTNGTDAIAIPGTGKGEAGEKIPENSAVTSVYSGCLGLEQGIVHPPGYTGG
jgi:hypothetical protein